MFASWLTLPLLGLLPGSSNFRARLKGKPAGKARAGLQPAFRFE